MSLYISMPELPAAGEQPRYSEREQAIIARDRARRAERWAARHPVKPPVPRSAQEINAARFRTMSAYDLFGMGITAHAIAALHCKPLRQVMREIGAGIDAVASKREGVE